MYGKRITQSRAIAAYATHPMHIKYSGAEIEVHVPFPPAVARICERVEERLGEKFNHVLMNRCVLPPPSCRQAEAERD